ncbi:Rid family hydrolase, partial [Escherichia coli]|uniref:Rid family hydrolase n=1 Tax=Escherichia coli TaxID=562 RepID=UPI00201CE7C3
MVERTAVFPAGRHSLYAEHRYSAAIRSGDLLFVSGQVGSREDGTPEPDFQQQVRLAFDNLHATLAAAGCTFDDWICPYISRHLLSLNPLQAHCRRYSRG